MKKVLSIILVVVILASINLSVAADSVKAVNSDYSFKVNGNEYNTTGDQSGIQSDAVVNGNITVTVGDEIRINGDIVKGTDKLELDLHGQFYPFAEGSYKDKMILGEFASNTKNIVVDSVRLDKNETKGRIELVSDSFKEQITLSIKVENSLTNKTYYVQSEVSAQKYDEILKQSKNAQAKYMGSGHNRDDYIQKVISLDLNKSALAGSSSEVECSRAESSGGDKAAEQVMIPASTAASKTHLSDFTYTQLKDFITAIRNSGSSGVSLSSYSVSESLFTATGWDHYTNLTSSPCFSSDKYTSDGGSGVYYTRLDMLDVIHSNNAGSSSYFTANVQMQMKYAIMVECVAGTGTVRLYLDNYGLKTQGQMCIGQLAGNLDNIFTSRTIYGAVKSNSYNVLGLIALIPNAKYLTALWGVYSTSEPGKFNTGPVLFGSTVSEQLTRWNNVVRGIELDSSSSYIQDVGNYYGISGEISWKTTWSYSWGLQYTTSTI